MEPESKIASYNAEKWSRPFSSNLPMREIIFRPTYVLHKRADFTNSVTRISFFTLPFFKSQLKNIDCKSLLGAEVCTQFIEKSSRCITWDMSVQDVWKDEIFDLTSLTAVAIYNGVIKIWCSIPKYVHRFSSACKTLMRIADVEKFEKYFSEMTDELKYIFIEVFHKPMPLQKQFHPIVLL